MTRIKKWILMSVFIIIVALTTNVSAKTYVADDSVNVSSQYHDIFNNYFGESKKYTYFPYSCNYGSYNNRTCYFGIDSDNNYLDISYIASGNSYELNYSKGVDDNFSVSGTNIFVHNPSSSTIVAYSIIFFSIIILILYLI